MIIFAKELVVSQSEFIAWYQLSATGLATKAINVIDFVVSSHYKIIFVKPGSTFVAFRPKQSVQNKKKIEPLTQPKFKFFKAINIKLNSVLKETAK